MPLRHKIALVALALATIISAPTGAQTPPSWTQVGGLSCRVDPSIGFLIFGHQPMDCRFTPNTPAMPPQFYDGAINTVGLDVGVSGDIGLGVGAGANVLLGGSARSFALQPLSLQGSIAVNVVLGVSSLKLRVR